MFTCIYISDDEDKENAVPMTQTDGEAFLTSSKDTSHLLRLSAALHILCHYWSAGVNGEIAPAPCHEIELDYVKRAQMLLNSVAQQKDVYLQVRKSNEYGGNTIYVCF